MLKSSWFQIQRQASIVDVLFVFLPFVDEWVHKVKVYLYRISFLRNPFNFYEMVFAQNLQAHYYK